jgi:transposase
MKENGATEKQITEAVGCSKQVIYKLWALWKATVNQKQKIDILTVKTRGIKVGEGRTLTPSQETKIQTIIKDKYPDQLKFDFALWTREAVRELIEKQYGIAMPIRTVGEYLKRWGYTPQKPIKYAYERNDKQVQEWVEKTYPGIKRRAKRLKATIYWGDEATIKASDVRGRGYAPRGKTPVVRGTKLKEDIGIISAITNQGKVMWKTYDGSIDAEKFIEFIRQLIKYRKKKVFLIVDGASAHKSKIVKRWVEAHKGKIELFYLPPYSPDLNPDEHINADVKYGVGSKQPKRNKEMLREATEEHMTMLDHSPKRIKRYFLDPAIKYAA